MKRVMVNLDDKTGELLEGKAAREKRSASSYVALLVEADLRAAGLMPADPASITAEALAEIQAAIVEQPALLNDIQRTIQAKRRRAKVA